MAITITTFKVRYPELYSSDASEQTRMKILIEDARQASKLPDEESIMDLAAHFVVLSRTERDQQNKKDYGQGELTAEQFISKRGEFMTFASINSEVFFTTTPYGRMYLLKLRTFRGVGIVNLNRQIA